MGGRLTLTSCWRAVGASVTGSSHRARDEPGQDALAMRPLADGGLVVAVADGAGSAPLAAEGSALAVAAAVAAVEMGFGVEDAFEVARDALGDGEDAALRATTLLVAVLRDDAVEVGQVGDGFVVVSCDGAFEVAVPGAAREYVNETTFLSSDGWRDDLRVDALDPAGVDGVALTTDGLQLVAVELATATAHARFFTPLFAWAAEDGASDAELEQFLGSERLAARTDDDLTLALAVRRDARPCTA